MPRLHTKNEHDDWLWAEEWIKRWYLLSSWGFWWAMRVGWLCAWTVPEDYGLHHTDWDESWSPYVKRFYGNRNC